MAIFNYLFYRISQLKIYRPTYWAKIFVPIIELIVVLPAGLTLSKYFFGCYNQKINEGIILIILSSVVILVMIANSFYYSPNRTKRLTAKYSGESKSKANIKLLFIVLLLLAIFLFGGDAVRLLIEVPEC